jgi:hypothetical protein
MIIMRRDRGVKDPWGKAYEIAHGAFDEAWFTKAIGRAIIEAMEEERERCAKIAEKYSNHYQKERDHYGKMGEEIAREIREGG